MRIKEQARWRFRRNDARRFLYSLIYGPRLAAADPALKNRVRGLFQELDHRDGMLHIAGWMLLPRAPLDSIAVVIDGKHATQALRRERPDVADAFPDIAHAGRTGFTAAVPVSLDPDQMVDIHLVANAGGKPAGHMAAWYSPNVRFRIPPADLMKRVTGSDDTAFFCASSFQSFRDLWDVVRRWRQPASIATALDWGCGCGRLVNTLRSLSPLEAVHGCDIDAQAIDWCRQNFADVRFSVNPRVPPTEYLDNTFDLVIGNSVLTHLTEELQVRWLEEIRRITAPGGLCLASVHGDYANSFCRADARVRYILARDGIFDEWRDESLKGVAPDDYYRDTLQTQGYTRRVYRKYLEILDYVEGGWLKFQDLVVMKKT
jgi:SAM-dependent methyltransferase